MRGAKSSSYGISPVITFEGFPSYCPLKVRERDTRSITRKRGRASLPNQNVFAAAAIGGRAGEVEGDGVGIDPPVDMADSGLIESRISPRFGSRQRRFYHAACIGGNDRIARAVRLPAMFRVPQSVATGAALAPPPVQEATAVSTMMQGGAGSVIGSELE